MFSCLLLDSFCVCLLACLPACFLPWFPASLVPAYFLGSCLLPWFLFTCARACLLISFLSSFLPSLPSFLPSFLIFLALKLLRSNKVACKKNHTGRAVLSGAPIRPHLHGKNLLWTTVDWSNQLVSRQLTSRNLQRTMRRLRSV